MKTGKINLHKYRIYHVSYWLVSKYTKKLYFIDGLQRV